MSYISNTAFQIRRSNDRYDDLQHRTGLFGSWSGASFITEDASAGLLCNLGDGIPEGGNYMTVAADGTAKLYAANTTYVQMLSNGVNTWTDGVETLGLGIPAGRKDTFAEIKVGETYAFGPGNFTTLATTTNKYATVANGLLGASSSMPSAADGYFFEIDTELGIDNFVEANYNAFGRYNMVACKL